MEELEVSPMRSSRQTRGKVGAALGFSANQIEADLYR